MAIAFVQSVQAGTSGGNASTIGFNTAAAAGNTLILSVSTSIGNQAIGGSAYTSVYSNISGTTFVKILSSAINHGDGYYEESQIWAAYNVPAGAHNVTVDGGTGSNDYGQLFLSEFSGVANVSVVDAIGSSTGDTTLGQFDTSISAGTTTQSDELAFAAFSAGGSTNLSGYFSTGITTPSGFTSIGFDSSARLGNRALSHSYRILNVTGPQTVSWGTIDDPGAGEKLVWAANVATLKAQVSGLTVSGTTLAAPASLITGAATAIRRDAPAGQTLTASGTLVAGAAQGRTNAVANSSGGTSAVSASLIAGNAVGIPISTTGGASLASSAALVSGNAVGQRQSITSSALLPSSSSLIDGALTARKIATPSAALLTVNTSLLSGASNTVNSAIINGVVFYAAASVGNQKLTFTFDSTTQPTFDNDQNYTFDSDVVSSGISAIPFGVVFGRQASLLIGSVTAVKLGTAGSIVLANTATLLAGNPTVVTLGSIPGALFSVPANFLAGAAVGQRSALPSGAAFVSSSSLTTGTATATASISPAGVMLSAFTAFVPGTTSAQVSKIVTGSVLSAASNLTAGVFSNSLSTTTPNAGVAAIASIINGTLIGQKNNSIGGAILSAASSIVAGSAQSQNSQVEDSKTLGIFASLIPGSAVSTKSISPVGRLFVTSNVLLTGAVNGAQSRTVTGQTLTAAGFYVAPTGFSVQSALRPGQTFIVRPELLAAQATSVVNANVNGRTLAASVTVAPGTIVYFAAVTVISQTIAAQSAFLAGTVTGKQLTRRNTGGRAFYFLQEFLQPIVGQELIFSEQNGPRPAKPYATLSVRSISEQEIIQHHLNGDGIVSLAKLQRMIVEVEYFGLGAFSKAQILGLKLQSPSNVDRGDTFGISVSQLRGVTRVPELLNQSQYEERAILEFTAYIMVEGDDNVGLIEHAVVQDTDADHACSFDFVYEGLN